ncbi:MAG: glycoside hydrolase family 16 protein [Acutalibacteraceae bacterium]|nr:glycoside hydrolase family 16 protein [Acutalibacteraceae bacterium]
MLKTLKFIISLALVASISLSCIIMDISSSDDGSSCWNGEIASSFAGGNGTASNPYLISDGGQLALAVSGYAKYWNAHFKLTNDIYLNDITKIDFKTGVAKEGYIPRKWICGDLSDSNSGYFDGAGYTIYGLYYNEPSSTKNAALFPYTWSGIKANDLGINCAYINTSGVGAAFIGFHKQNKNISSSFTNCFVGENVSVNATSAAGFISYGYAGKATFINCYSAATLNTKNSYYGGLTADANGITVLAENCYSVGKTDGGNCKTITYTNCYSTYGDATGLTVLSSDSMKGEIADGNKMILGEHFVATEGYPVLKTFIPDYDNVWSGLGELITDGNGTEDDPYLICSAGQLAYMVGSAGNSKYYKLTNDIYLNNIDKIDWTVGYLLDNDYEPRSWFTGNSVSCSSYKSLNSNSDSFKGSLDGSGHTVYGLWYDIEMNDTTSGLIPSAQNSSIRNLTVDNSFIVGGRFTATLSSWFDGIVENCMVNNVTVCGKKNVSSDSYSVAGLLAYTNGIKMTDCGFNGRLVKHNNVSISHCYGLIGTSWGTVVDASDCYSLAYAPFAVSIKQYKYDNIDIANTKKDIYFDLYKVKNVYTNVESNNTNAYYFYDSDGIDTDGDGKLEYDVENTVHVFDFDILTYAQITGNDALDNMPALDRSWYTISDKTPILKTYGNAIGDADRDGEFDYNKDLLFLRNTLINANNREFDSNCDGKSNVCDLVDLTKRDKHPLRYAFFDNRTTSYNTTDLTINDYCIIYPEGNENAYSAAQKLQKHYSNFGVDLAVFSDAVPPVQKEIIIGNTNRIQPLTLADNEYCTYVSDNKLIFSSNSDDNIVATVADYISIANDKTVAICTNGTASFNPDITLSNGRTYSYVWGDEFSFSDINFYKWVYSVSGTNMGNCVAEGLEPDIIVLSNPDVIKIVDGNLRLTPILYNDPEQPNLKYGVPASVRTNGTMAFRYGYAEIRAKVPFKTGVWPSYWTGTSRSLGELTPGINHRVEVDVFEIFGSVNEVVPQIHKIYDKNLYDYNAIHGTNVSNNRTQGPSSIRKTFKFENYENLSDEYHTYGYEWTPTEISMYVDGYCYNTYDITKSYDKCPDMEGFQDPRYIIFNNHVFSPNSRFKPNCIEGHEENLPANYDIDYFRLYQSDSVERTQIWTK